MFVIGAKVEGCVRILGPGTDVARRGIGFEVPFANGQCDHRVEHSARVDGGKVLLRVATTGLSEADLGDVSSVRVGACDLAVRGKEPGRIRFVEPTTTSPQSGGFAKLGMALLVEVLSQRRQSK